MVRTMELSIIIVELIITNHMIIIVALITKHFAIMEDYFLSLFHTVLRTNCNYQLQNIDGHWDQ